ncbi:hypothetical protein F443_18434 [Phytophthora nicotianae P1569]|uniref:RxLR effector protein n=1 Tax=Phytophthora nicotianae P1569 TaxID=1317065 RepID=V9DTL2_PHYNI|nr:hypothetical protein F443_22915 [Phytophthora nicotianae P1569]ETI35175.1 hypothetical protein F443_18434 [Phytophthora nicotianae P1569]
MVLVLLANREALAGLHQSKASTESSTNAPSDYQDRTLLRTLQTENKSVSKISDAENRGLPFSVPTWVKNKYWSITGKTEDDVVKILGLYGLSRAAQKKHVNYKYLQEYRYMMEGKQLDEWVRRGDTMDSVWQRLGLVNIPVKVLESTKEFNIYLRFMKRFDKSIKSQYDEGTVKALWVYYMPLTEGQQMANIKVWKNARRSRSYVRAALGLDISDYNAAYFKQFLHLRNKKKK